MKTGPVANQWTAPVEISGLLKRLLVGFSLLFGLILLWALFAELHEGAIATGEVIPFGKTKTIQHLEGGIVREILVMDGDAVLAGQDLLVLEDKEAKALLALAHTDWAARSALVSRLEAERDNKVYEGGTSTDHATLSQLRIFEIRRQSLRSELAALNKRNLGLKSELEAWKKRSTALGELTDNAGEERNINQTLYEKNFISRPRLLALDSQLSDRKAAKGETEAEMARVTQRISDTELQISKLKSDWINAVLEELRKAQDELSVTTEKLQVAQDRLRRVRIQSPHDGVIKGLRYTTLGAVIPPGGVVVDVVPVTDKMIIEARVQPDDIDVVHTGTPAKVRLTAYKARAHMSYDGIVNEVSPSTFTDEKTGMRYYLARVEISDLVLGKDSVLSLQPGMLADVSFTGQARSPIRYLLDPLRQSFTKAFREE